MVKRKVIQFLSDPEVVASLEKLKCGVRLLEKELEKTTITTNTSTTTNTTTTTGGGEGGRTQSDDLKSRQNVTALVKEVLQTCLKKDTFRNALVLLCEKILSKWGQLSKKQLFIISAERFDELNLHSLFDLLKSSPIAFCDKIAHDFFVPILHTFLHQFQLDTTTINLTDNPVSKARLTLSNIHISVPSPPQHFKIRTTSESEYRNNGRVISSAIFSISVTLILREVPVIMKKTDFEYEEKGVFASMNRKGTFDVEMKSFSTALTLVLQKRRKTAKEKKTGNQNQKSDGKIPEEPVLFIKPGNEQLVKIAGFNIKFSQDVKNFELLNKLSSTFNQEITAAVAKGLEKKFSRLVAETASDLNELLSLVRSMRGGDEDGATGGGGGSSGVSEGTVTPSQSTESAEEWCGIESSSFEVIDHSSPLIKQRGNVDNNSLK